MTDTTPKVRMFMGGQDPLVQALYESLQKNGVDVTDDQFDKIFFDLCVGLSERSKLGMAGLVDGLGHKLPNFKWRSGQFDYVVDLDDARWTFTAVLPTNRRAPTHISNIVMTEIKGMSAGLECRFADVEIDPGPVRISPWRAAHWLDSQYRDKALPMVDVKIILDNRAPHDGGNPFDE